MAVQVVLKKLFRTSTIVFLAEKKATEQLAVLRNQRIRETGAGFCQGTLSDRASTTVPT